MLSWFPVRLALYAVIVYIFISLYNLFPVFLAKYTATTEDKNNTQEQILNIATPTKIIIPKIGIDTKVLPVGRTFSGSMEVPNSLKNVGWYKYGVHPGEKGNAVIAGHEIDELGFGAIFKNLYLLKPGDEIVIETEGSGRIEFVVQNTEVYKYNDAPLEKIFGNSSNSNLNLITCEGTFISRLKTKDQRLIVFSTLKK